MKINLLIILIICVNSKFYGMEKPSLAHLKEQTLVPKTEAAKKLYTLAQKQINAQEDLDAPMFDNRPLLANAALSDEHLATTWLLLAHGADPDALCPLGKTPLLYAAEKSNFRTIGILLHFNANPNHLSYTGKYTPLHVLCSPSRDSFVLEEIEARQHSVEWLLAAEANTNAQDSNGTTPFFGLVACSKKDTSSVLLPPQQKNIFHQARKNLIQVFLACKANPDTADITRKTLFTQTIHSVDPYLSIYIAFKFKKRREKLREVLLTFLKTSPHKPDAQSQFKCVPPDILRYILKIAYP